MGFLTATRGEAVPILRNPYPVKGLRHIQVHVVFFALFKVLWVPRIRYAAQIYPTSVFIDYSSPVSNKK